MKILTPNAKYVFESNDTLEGKDLIDSQNVVRESWVENVYQINEGDFNDSAIFVDAGANIGAVSLFVAAMNDNRDPSKKPIKVFAIEPEPHNLALLSKNIKENGKAEQIKIITKGLAGGKLTAGMTNQGGNSQMDLGAKEQNIEFITLEDFFNANKIAECDVLKMDIEGSEYNVLLQSGDETLKRIKYLTLEFTGGYQSAFGELTARLAELFNLHIIGKPSQGGYIYGRRY